MHLLIRAVSLAGQPLTQAISAYFDERGGTMGRSDTNTLSLPDPERRISRLQAEVARTAAGWQLLNVGNANPIWHNNKAVPPGETVLLDEGDELQVGTYSLHVSYASTEAARTITQGRAAVDSRTVLVGSGTEARTDPSRMASSFSVQMTASPRTTAAAPQAGPDHDVGATQLVPGAGRVDLMPAASPFADLLGTPAAASAPAAQPGGSPFDDLFSAPLVAGASSVGAGGAGGAFAPVAAAVAPDPFADLLGAGAGPATSSPWGLGARSTSVAPAVPARLPDDFDPFAGLSPSKPDAAASPFDSLGLGGAPAGQAAAGQLQGLDFMGGQGGGAQGGSTSSIDQLFGLSGSTSSADPLAGFLARTAPAAPQEAAVGAPSSIDPLALLTPSPAPQARADSAPHPAAASFSTLPDDVPEVQGMMPLPAVVDAPRAAEPTQAAPATDATSARVTVHGFSAALSAAAAAVPSPAPAPAPFVRDRLPDDASFDNLLSGLAPTQPAALSVQPVELPALTAHAPRTQLKGSPLLVASNHGDETGDTDPLTSLSGRIALAEPVAFHTLMPHQTPEAPESDTQPGALGSVTSAGHAGAPVTGIGTATTGADTLALWSAFCQGAGVNFTPPQGLNPDLMRVIGRLLRSAIDGSVKLVAARAATKQELRAEVTVIQAKGNNPLKFSPDAESALEQLLQPPLRGFMPGPEAVSDAMDDLLGHTIGTMVGTRAALEGVLQRFEPTQLESKLAGRSMMDSLLPMNRRAKLWELYLQHYDSVRTEAQEDFHNLFGRAFLQAYEEQLDRLDAERRAQKSTRSA
jgi:FHA domain-containing protein